MRGGPGGAALALGRVPMLFFFFTLLLMAARPAAACQMRQGGQRPQGFGASYLLISQQARPVFAQNIQMSFATQDIPCASVSKGFPASGLPFGDKCAFRAASHTAARPACALFPRAA